MGRWCLLKPLRVCEEITKRALPFCLQGWLRMQNTETLHLHVRGWEVTV